jgi:hypothetical protein
MFHSLTLDVEDMHLKTIQSINELVKSSVTRALLSDEGGAELLSHCFINQVTYLTYLFFVHFLALSIAQNLVK